jgi:hypothetical protein
MSLLACVVLELLAVSVASERLGKVRMAPEAGQTRFGNGQRACDVVIYVGAPRLSEYEDSGR